MMIIPMTISMTKRISSQDVKAGKKLVNLGDSV
jgi:hypothetical protein